MKEQKSKKECKHEKVVMIGLWDGKDENGKRTGGPEVECMLCKEHLFISWEDWHKIPSENKTD